MTFLGIYREPEYSPGRHTSNDALILRLVGQALERSGVNVRLAELDEARGLWKSADLIFSMCQGPQAVGELARWKQDGAYIVNDPLASRQAYRNALCLSLPDHGIPFPYSVFLPTNGSAELSACQRFFQGEGAWIKRYDVHATQKGDVLWISKLNDLADVLERFHKRGLDQVVLQEHRSGDEVKFYGVRGGRFFWPYYPNDCHGYPFDENILKKITDDAAQTVGLNIYGGDAIISPEGKITLIDLNDWPSFAPCRGAAAMAIANHLKDIYDTAKNRRETTIARA